jgi:hypothetical protein
MRRNAQMISCSVAIGGRFNNPIDVAANQVEQFPGHHRDFTCINTIGTENGAAAAFGALVKVIEPFFQHFFG